jgi:hypothetical protein
MKKGNFRVESEARKNNIYLIVNQIDMNSKLDVQAVLQLIFAKNLIWEV